MQRTRSTFVRDQLYRILNGLLTGLIIQRHDLSLDDDSGKEQEFFAMLDPAKGK